MSLRDVIGDKASTDVMEQLHEFWSACKAIGWKDMRPWSEFFGAFKVPQLNLRHMEQRMTTNLLHYRSNYLSVFLVLFVLNCLYKPSLFFTVLTCTWLFIAAFVLVKKNMHIGDVIIKRSHRLYLCISLTIFMLLVTSTLESLLWFFLVSISVIILHAMFRPRSVSSKAGKAYDEMKLNGFSWMGLVGATGKDDFAGSSSSSTVFDPENPRMQKDD